MHRKIIVLSGVIAVGLLVLGTLYFSPVRNYWQPMTSQHGGKLLTDGSIAAEIKMEEKAGSANFIIYVYKNRKQISPSDATVTMRLKRFSDDVEVVQFKPENDYFKSQNNISEPHSFEVLIDLAYKGKNSQWKYDNFEGRITLPAETIKSSGIKTQVAGAGKIEKKMSVIGKIVPNRDEMTFIYPRFGGIVKEMKKNLGETVRKGEEIALIESNESLKNYPLVSPIDGTIVQKNAIMGDMIKEDKAIYQIANLSTVWADLTLYRNEASLIKVGMPVTVVGSNGAPIQSGQINYISPLGIEDSQTILARVVLPNEKQEWVPGMFVDAAITYVQKDVPVSVLLSAIQRIGDEDVIFVQKENTFEATPIELGTKNGDKVEIISGIKPGQSYVSENSFLLKAEMGKSEAEHEH